VETLELRAVLLQQQQRWEEAAATYGELCRQSGACIDRFIAWGCCLYELGRIADCREALLSAPPAARDHGCWNFHLACYEAQLGRAAEARELVRRCLELEPRLRAMAERNSNLGPLLRGDS
jgi:tetratricopeptide (TPR) repeat protein